MTKKILPQKPHSYLWILRPILATVLLAFFILWINDAYLGFNDRGVYITSFIASFILIFPSFLLIRLLEANHRILRGCVILLVAFIGIPMAGYFSDTSTFFRPKPLENALIYTGPMPEPEMIQLPSGEIISWFMGQVNLFANPKTDPKTIESLIASVDGKILSKIPEFGYYFFEIPKDIEASISKIKKESYILAVEPNLLIVPTGDIPVDLTDTSADPKTLTATLLKSPDPSAGVITVEIDIFKNKHNLIVNGIREAAGAKGPVFQIDVGSVKCGENNCSSADRVYSAVSAVLAGAQMNRQKVVVNIPLSVMSLTNNAEIFSKKNGPGSNKWATEQWESFTKGILNIVQSSEWSKKGNIVINQSAGNGACLTGKNNSIMDCTGVDLSDLLLLSMLENNYMYIHGVEEKGVPAKYSNHGTGVIMKEIPPDSKGTSVATAIATAETEKVWQANRFKKAKEISSLLKTAICPGGLQVCGNSCIPTNAECCNYNVYCLQPGGSCLVRKPGTCSICPVGKKFCGMFCVDISKKCQTEVLEQELPMTNQEPASVAPKTTPSQKTSTQKKTTPNLLKCNGKEWNPCKAGEQFYCPSSGDPYCDKPGLKSCNGTYWKDCEAGTHFVCNPSGASCELDKVKEEELTPPLPTPTDPQPTEPDSGYDPNACTRKINDCKTACYQTEDACTKSCPTGWGSDPCFGACYDAYDTCLNTCTCD